jgi:hypothetical protein
MPWTPKEKRFLLSSGSPLSGAQKTKMKAELHKDPALGHAKKGHIDRGQRDVKNPRGHADKLRSS